MKTLLQQLHLGSRITKTSLLGDEVLATLSDKQPSPDEILLEGEAYLKLVVKKEHDKHN